MKQPEKAARKQAANAGTWRPGQSGNSRGRPRGSGRVAELRQSIEASIPAIIKAMVDRALSGDSTAARLLIERVISPIKPSEDMAVIDMPSGGDLSAQANALIAALAAGKVSAGQASVMMSTLALAARIREVDELERRIAKLERDPDAEP